MQKVILSIFFALVLAGCGIQSPALSQAAVVGGMPSPATHAPAPAATAVPVPTASTVPADAVIVEYSRSGGIAGRTVSYAIRGDGTVVVGMPGGHVRAGAGGEVLQTSGGAQAAAQLVAQITATNISAVTPGDYSGKNACCDRYAYELSVFVNGTHYSYTTVEGTANQPQQLADVINLVQAYLATIKQ